MAFHKEKERICGPVSAQVRPWPAVPKSAYGVNTPYTHRGPVSYAGWVNSRDFLITKRQPSQAGDSVQAIAQRRHARQAGQHPHETSQYAHEAWQTHGTEKSRGAHRAGRGADGTGPGAHAEQAQARNEKVIYASELRYRRLFETAQDGILILDARTGQVVDANPFMKDLLGYSQEEFLGRKLWEIGPFKGEDASKSAFVELQVNDRLHYEGLPLETKDGRRVEVEFISNAYLVDKTRLIQCNIRDITERMRVNLALETSNKELAFECEERGKRAEELALINVERTDVNLALKTAVKELAFECEEKGKRADELAVLNEERMAANKELAFQVEEKGKRADELTLINVELARSNSELEQFAYVATHDLQEPLRAVASCVQLLQKRYEGQLDERADEFITHAVDGTKRMQTLINDLLAYSRISTHAKPFESTDCGEVLGEALANLVVAIGESGAVVTRDALPVVGGGDCTQLTQLFQNLIGNALKFRGKRPPKIHIGATLEDGEWQFSVADNGIGMDPQYFERVFLVFQRLHTRKKYQGTGIGLAVCKKVVERHGGRIWIESEPEKGATFCFTIPEGK